jgi:hypothetical protein
MVTSLRLGCDYSLNEKLLDGCNKSHGWLLEVVEVNIARPLEDIAVGWNDMQLF